MKIHLQAKAKKDLKEIFKYSYKKWGDKQAHLYLESFDKAFSEISSNQQIGFACDYICNGYKQLNVNKHMVFYKIQKSKISIIRVLHEKMDYKTNLQ